MLQPAEIISTGKELLIGKILNTNAQWLAKKITTLGLDVRRITTVGDNFDDISSAVEEAIQRSPSFLIITGGLGPTHDDKTLKAVAEALGSELVVSEEALCMVKQKVKTYVEEGKIKCFKWSPYMTKMAKIPEGAKPLGNPVGTAPAVLMNHLETVLISLPGVPEEMKEIFQESVAPLLKKTAGNRTFSESNLRISDIGESEIAPIIVQVMDDNPGVYVKSCVKESKNTLKIELHISTRANSFKAAEDRVNRARDQISELIRTKGGKVQMNESNFEN